MKKIILISIISLCISFAKCQWQQCNIDYASYYAIASDNSNVIASTFFFAYDFGFIGHTSLSSTSGNTWLQRDSGLFNPLVYSLLIKDSMIFAGTSYGIYSSNNDGVQWLINNDSSTYTGINCLETDGYNIYAGTNGGGILISYDNGVSWNFKNSGLQNLYVKSIAFLDSNIVIATNNGAFISSISLIDWVLITQSINDTLISSVETSNDFIFIATVNGIYKSDNYGINWISSNNGLTDIDVRLLAVKNNNIYAFPSCSGMFTSFDNGTSWISNNNGWTSNCVYSVTINDSNIYAGTASGIWKRPLSDTTEDLVLKRNPFNFKCYPNPAYNEIFIEISNIEQRISNIEVFKIYGIDGKLIIQGKLESPKTRISTKELESGVYFIEVSIGNEKKNSKLVITR